MRVVQPFAVTDAVLTASNIPETAPAAWSSGTTYAKDALAGIVTGTEIDVYQSLLAGNLNHAPASSPTWWAAVATTYAVYDVAVTYAEDAIVIDPSPGGHHAYASLVAANLGAPLTDDTKWLDLGADNRWRMFDQSVQSQTQAAHLIDVTLAVTGRIDTVAFLNVDAASGRVTMTDAVEGVVFDRTYSLVSASGITDWYAWFFTPIERLSSFVVEGLPPYADPTLRVRLSDLPANYYDGLLDFSLADGQQTGFLGIL